MSKQKLYPFQAVEIPENHLIQSALTPENQAPFCGTDCSLNAVTNAEFISAIFHTLFDNASIAVCSKSGDPTEGGWLATAIMPDTIDLKSNQNNYVNCSSFSNNDDFNVKKENFQGLHCLLLDDIGQRLILTD